MIDLKQDMNNRAQTMYDDFDQELHCMGLQKEELYYLWAISVRMSFLYSEYLTRFSDRPGYDRKMTHLPVSARWFQTISIATQLVDMVTENNDKLGKSIINMIIKGADKADKVFGRFPLCGE